MSGSKAVGTPGVKTTPDQLAADKELAYQRHNPYMGRRCEVKLPLGRPSRHATRGERSVQMDVDAHRDGALGAKKGW